MAQTNQPTEPQDGHALTCHVGDIIGWQEWGVVQWRGCVVDLWANPTTGEPTATVQTAFGLRDVQLHRDQPTLVRAAAQTRERVA